jgi:hypothetical protein
LAPTINPSTISSATVRCSEASIGR